MKIKELQISNILSFAFHQDITNAPKITFDDQLNILIGGNGSGKSTALEVINFIFKKVLLQQFTVNQESYSQQSTLTEPQRKKIITNSNNNSYSGFRLDANWDNEEEQQQIRMEVELDEIDKFNIQSLVTHREKLASIASTYSNYPLAIDENTHQNYIFDISLNKGEMNFTTRITPDNSDLGYLYLNNYNLFKELIALYNNENPADQINPLFESFTLIGGYRNYHNFNPSISLANETAEHQIQQIKSNAYGKSLNSSEAAEPSVFNLVRLRVAQSHFGMFGSNLNEAECEEKANELPFVQAINEKLGLVNLKCKIRLIDLRTWKYSFEFIDVLRKITLKDINSLSSGQKAIIHLVFEAYGRGEMQGGVVIIDEPEIHLHYQFQNEYLRIIQELNFEQRSQYILVTHSESLIYSATIHNVKRFSLDKYGSTQIKAPHLTADQRMLVKILDNTRSTYAFFAQKVMLVEGETDRYFLNAAIREISQANSHDVAVLDIGGKSNRKVWKDFFHAFGLRVFFMGDLDVAFNLLYPDEEVYKLNRRDLVDGFRSDHPGIDTEIENLYEQLIFILKQGDLEYYLDIHPKGLPSVIKFCNESLEVYLGDTSNERAVEIVFLCNKVLNG